MGQVTQGRIDKTIDKTRRGGLPAPTDDKPSREGSYGQRCSGCGETIESSDEQYLVNIRGVALLRFHNACYNAWATFARGS
jgi:hypothetical protein